MPRFNKRMNNREQRIWDAAYAEAFIREFADTRARGTFDRAVELSSAEAAIIAADLVVIRLREWKVRENQDAGIYLSDFYADKEVWDDSYRSS